MFQNFDYDAYFRADPAGLLTNIQQFVEEDGKGFVMVGGERSFDLGGYGGTSIEDMLPVDLRQTEPLIDETHFRSVLTADGERHPVTRLLPDPAKNQAWWSRLSKTDGVNRVGGLSKGATVLLEHPTLKGRDGLPMPVLAVAEAGKGRAMALTVDTSWRWSITEAAHGRGNQAYLRFWKNAFKWLMKDPESSRVTVDTPQENYGVGDTVRIIVRARDTGFAPLERAEVIAHIDGPNGRTEVEGLTTPDGDVALEFPAAVRGAHRVSVEVRHRDKLVGKGKTVFAVTTRDPELDEVSPDAEFLKWLATSTGGKFFGPDQLGAPIRDPSSGRTVWERREAALWRAPILGIWILLFGGLTWIVRRRSGMR
ncbi:MAG: putative membrane protein [Kiritimatiellia bacterium]